MRGELSAMMSRVRMQVYQAKDFSQIPKWLCDNTKHPIDVDKPWSFKDHEYQIEIMADTAPEVSMQKPSQVGASEFSIRLMLAMMGISKKITIIYILPTSGMATKFASGRIDPVIIDSPVLQGLVNKNLNNTKQKQVGRSLMYIAGTIGQNSAISVPAQALFRDEVDFCNQKVLTTFNSRIGHSGEGEAIVRSFSTPTVFNYGINLLYNKGSQATRMVKCGHCHTWVDIDYLRDVVIPGFDKPLLEFEREDLNNSFVRVDEAFFRCVNCRNAMNPIWFMDLDRRRWVHRHPERTIHHSYQVLPIDVPTINPLARTLRQIDEYDSKKDWFNFKIGVPFEDAQSTFVLKLIEEHQIDVNSLTVPDYEIEEEAKVARVTSRHCFMGMDVGKTSWITVLADNDKGGQDVIYRERVRQDGSNYAGRRAWVVFQAFNCAAGVVDAGPDFSIASFLTDKGRGRFFACQYVVPRANSKVLDIIQTKNDETKIIQVHRSGSFDELSRKVNLGLLRFNKGLSEEGTAKKHSQAMKRIELKDPATGEVRISWESIDEDHYTHALNYAHLAKLLSGIRTDDGVIPYIPMIGKVAVKDGGEDTKRAWPARFGF